jgi:SAM-dependent methyltransferase
MENYRDNIYLNYSKHTEISGQTPSMYSYQKWYETYKWYLREWLPEDKNTPILDIGCGSGYFLWMASKLGYTNITGIDLSESQLQHARDACTNAKIICGDVIKVLGNSGSKFGLIAGFDFIEHLKKDEILRLFDQIEKLLLPGGRVIFQAPNLDSPWGMSIQYGDFTHETAFTPTGLNSLMNIAGLEDYQARECGPYPHGFVSFVRFLLWKCLRAFIIGWNLVELGNTGSRVFTRVFLGTARKTNK